MFKFLGIALISLIFSTTAQGEEGYFYHAKIFCPYYGCPLEVIREEAEEILVLEPSYVVIKMNIKRVRVAGLRLYKTKESDYIQRPIRITVKNRDEVQLLNSIGMDIWEVGDDYVFGRAMDYMIDKIEDTNLPYELIKTP